MSRSMPTDPPLRLLDHDSFRTYLAAWQTKRQRQDPTFTRSEFARRLGVPNSRGLLGEIIDGRKLTDSFIERFVAVLELGPEEARLFHVKVRYEQSESEAERDLFRPHLATPPSPEVGDLHGAALAAFQSIAPADRNETCRQIVDLTRSALGHVRAGILILDHPSDADLHGTWGTDHLLRTVDEREYVINRIETIDRVLDHLATTGSAWQRRNPAPIGHIAGSERAIVSQAWVEGHLLSTPRRHLGVLYVDPGLSLRAPDTRLSEATALWARLVSPLVERGM